MVAAILSKWPAYKTNLKHTYRLIMAAFMHIYTQKLVPVTLCYVAIYVHTQV